MAGDEVYSELSDKLSDLKDKISESIDSLNSSLNEMKSASEKKGPNAQDFKTTVECSRHGQRK
jgi:hypothetical protein